MPLYLPEMVLGKGVLTGFLTEVLIGINGDILLLPGHWACYREACGVKINSLSNAQTALAIDFFYSSVMEYSGKNDAS